MSEMAPREQVPRQPSLPGVVHGIVQMQPYVRIQCDGCGHIHDGQPGKTAVAIMLCGIRFNPGRYQRQGDQRDARRLCRDCSLREWGDQ